MTSYRSSDFDFDFDFGELLEYESPPAPKVSPPPSKAPAPPAQRMIKFVRLDKFPFKSVSIPSSNDSVMLRIAHLLVASQTIGMPIRVVELVGHADSAGSASFNLGVGRQRADAVRTKLMALMQDIKDKSATRVSFNVSSRGELDPIAPNTTAGNLLNRRVDVWLPATCQTFFAEYDLQSYPGDPVLGVDAHPNIDTVRRKAMVGRVVDELEIRLGDRASKALSGTIKPALPIPAANTTLSADAKELSAMQVELFKKYRPGPSNGFSQSGLNDCFQIFANGKMRSPNSAFPDQGVTEPDSQFFFLFAEFGFMCVDSGIQAAAWTQALRALVGGQEIFMHVYRKNPVSPPPAVNASAPTQGSATHLLEDFSKDNFKPIGGSQTRGEGQSDAARLSAVTAKYASMGINQLRANATVNLLRAQRL